MSGSDRYPKPPTNRRPRPLIMTPLDGSPGGSPNATNGPPKYGSSKVEPFHGATPTRRSKPPEPKHWLIPAPRNGVPPSRKIVSPLTVSTSETGRSTAHADPFQRPATAPAWLPEA